MHVISLFAVDIKGHGFGLGWTWLYAQDALFFSFLFGTYVFTCMATIILMLLIPVPYMPLFHAPHAYHTSFFKHHVSFTPQASTTTFSLTTILSLHPPKPPHLTTFPSLMLAKPICFNALQTYSFSFTSRTLGFSLTSPPGGHRFSQRVLSLHA